MAEGNEDSQNLITITVKSTKDKKNIEIDENADIKEVNNQFRVFQLGAIILLTLHHLRLY